MLSGQTTQNCLQSQSSRNSEICPEVIPNVRMQTNFLAANPDSIKKSGLANYESPQGDHH
jgi:hypothetical protein